MKDIWNVVEYLQMIAKAMEILCRKKSTTGNILDGLQFFHSIYHFLCLTSEIELDTFKTKNIHGGVYLLIFNFLCYYWLGQKQCNCMNL